MNWLCPLGRRISNVQDPVLDDEGAMHEVKGSVVVGHDEHGGPPFMGGGPEQLHHLMSTLLVEGGGWFIR
jgi:hypothetical protein